MNILTEEKIVGQIGIKIIIHCSHTVFVYELYIYVHVFAHPLSM